MKLYTQIILFLTLSCTIAQNKIEVDILTEVSIFPEYEKNLRFSLDMQKYNWAELFKKNISGFEVSDIKDLKIFINTREDEKITKIQLRFPAGNEPKNYSEIREIMLKQIEEMKKIYLENDTFISEATKLAEKHISLLDRKNYDKFFDIMAKEVVESIPDESKKKLVETREGYNIDSSQRKYLFRNIGIIDIADPDKINLVEVHYSINGGSKTEFIVYLLKNGEPVLYGYNL